MTSTARRQRPATLGDAPLDLLSEPLDQRLEMDNLVREVARAWRTDRGRTR